MVSGEFFVGPRRPLAQIVTMKVSDGLKGFRGDSDLSTSIYRIGTHAALDTLRSPAFKHQGQTVGLSESTKDGEADPAQENIPFDQQILSVEVTVIREEMSACIREFIECLPENHKTVMAAALHRPRTNAHSAHHGA